METGSTSKLCVLCGASCAGRPRIKDSKGRYYHKECYEEALAHGKAQQTDGGEPAAPGPFDPFGDIGGKPVSSQLPGTRPCPECSQPLAPGALVCIACGYSLETGRKLETSASGPAPKASASDPACSLCGRTKKMRKPKRLYGVAVCRKCYYAFANRRQLAFLVDALIWWPVSFLLGMALGVVLVIANASQTTADLVITLFGWLVFPLVFFLKDGFWGYSPGKAICRVQVVNRLTLEPTGVVPSLKRNLILIVPLMPLVIAWWLQRGYRLGDGWARTKVIWKKYAAHPLFTGRLACDRCEYDLAGSTAGRCPECGAPVPGLLPT